ncbi:unnamed protein product [Xylocopa violacea]|uniref:Uncharacterized protein n=1 Tax=Xylocopa violacea TaxID=135666 RepID=A0ABP1NHK0_XYLVO
MDHRATTGKLFATILLSAVLIGAERFEESKNGTPKEQAKQVEQLFEESSSEDEYSLRATSTTESTTESTTTIETYQKLTLSISGENNVSKEFRPSLHLGEIKESRIGAPFNNVHHIKFGTTVDPNSYHEHLNDLRFVFQPTHQTLPINQQANRHQNLFETTVGSLEEQRKDGMQQNGYVKFQDGALELPKVQYGGASKDQAYQQQYSPPITANIGPQYDLVDQQVFQNLDKPVFEQEAVNFWGKPSKFQGDAQKYETGGLLNVGTPKVTHYAGLIDHQGHQDLQEYNELFNKPSNGVVYVEESSFMRTRKFPYPIYQPQVGYQHVDLPNTERPPYALKKGISPWKKIIHLIGAFLPLGLLVAALTPKVVKVENTTQPNIVLSKWRVTDLPVEHKQARLTDASSGCEERSICDLILAGGDAGSSALQNMLWNLATRTSQTVAKESGLREVFEAVKKKDCANVPC